MKSTGSLYEQSRRRESTVVQNEGQVTTAAVISRPLGAHPIFHSFHHVQIVFQMKGGMELEIVLRVVLQYS